MATVDPQCLNHLHGVLSACPAGAWLSAAVTPSMVAGVAGVAVATLTAAAVGVMGWRFVAGQRGRRAWRESFPGTRKCCGPSAAVIAQGPDIHLVMNAFNRLAGEPRFEDSAAIDPIFLLSDYLRQCLTHSGGVQVALHEEVELLQTYLRLASGFHGRNIQASVDLAPGHHHTSVQAHSLCLAAQVLMSALPPEPPAPPQRNLLHIRLWGLPAGAIDAVLELTFPARAPGGREKRIRADIYRLCDNMSLGEVRWSCRVVRDGPGGVVLHLRIRRGSQPTPTTQGAEETFSST